MKSHTSSPQIRKRPTQKRSLQTFERILETATLLLEEVGFDKLTTNLICERAGLSPPALYRYFPDKYAILVELGEQLMAHQDDDLKEWLESDTALPIPPEKVEQLLRSQYNVTLAQTGSKWIMRSLYSTPQLVNVRHRSHEMMAEIITQQQLTDNPEASRPELYRRNRMILEMGYAILEMLIDNPEMGINATLKDAAVMLSALQ